MIDIADSTPAPLVVHLCCLSDGSVWGLGNTPENARSRAIARLMQLAELDPEFNAGTPKGEWFNGAFTVRVELPADKAVRYLTGAGGFIDIVRDLTEAATCQRYALRLAGGAS